MSERVIAVVPLRDGRSGKSRLSDELSPPQRTAVVRVLARHVIRVLLEADTERVLVVTREPDFARSVTDADPRVEIVVQPEERPGLNEAVTLAHEIAADRAADRLLIVHADLPLLRSDDVRALLAPAAPVVLAPDIAGTGTNALVLGVAARDFRFGFGAASRAAHARAAAGLGLRTAIVERAGTRTDLDTAADWAALPADVRLRLERSAGIDSARPASAVDHVRLRTSPAPDSRSA